ncbi:GIY-YIG nuclease family protein [Dubosiella newyorkensis]|uniref:GIY-YIG nuclease family protein n=1 Tax=Dubosiella newyorkensis TaxID=1862672 RepID=UPI002587226C|nr:GIY-YIG nuclease family protein [Dubosiella newyorkensis]
MTRGILYVMSTAVPGLVKIGKTDNFENRMYTLERNGYANVTALKREFAIRVEDYDEKEALLDDIFSKSRIENTELFALDLNLIIQLLSSLEGEQIYPKKVSKEEVFTQAADSREIKQLEENSKRIIVPDGEYYLDENRKGSGRIRATLVVQNNEYFVKKGSQCAPVKGDWQPEDRHNAKIQNGILQEDIKCKSLYTAGWIALGRANNGWKVWKDKNGVSLDYLRKRND